MSGIILRVLWAAAVLLLTVLGVLMAAVLLALFFPVSYRVSGEKSADKMTFRFRASWLFGLLRAGYSYPEPGKAVVKVFGIRIYESGKSGEKSGQGKSGKRRRKEAAGEEADKRREPEQAETGTKETETKGTETKGTGSKGTGTEETEKNRKEKARTEKTETEGTETEEIKAAETGAMETGTDAAGERETKESDENSSRISQIIAKIQYTFRSVYDKIKEIWQNISYYKDLFSDRETGLLFSHVMFRLGRILKSLRPRKLKAQVLFGTGAPDTTGYAFGLYGMLMPFLGPSVQVTPDFERAVLEGNFSASGFMTLAVLLWHVLQAAMDRRLKLFIDRIKRKKPKDGETSDDKKAADHQNQSSGGTERSGR